MVSLDESVTEWSEGSSPCKASFGEGMVTGKLLNKVDSFLLRSLDSSYILLVPLLLPIVAGSIDIAIAVVIVGLSF
jgi:hypothetical protein